MRGKKKISFLLPAIECALKGTPGQIKVLCVSPTRELASQARISQNLTYTYAVVLIIMTSLMCVSPTRELASQVRISQK